MTFWQSDLMEDGSDPLIAQYRLRTVRVAVLITYLTVGSLIAFPFLAGHPRVDATRYGALVAVALVGATVALVLPWRRLLEAGWAERIMFVWSALDIVLVTLGASLTGGPTSDVVFLYALTTLFFAASYPLSGQIGLLGF
ncbi:MAG TPA: hypothetical protein VGR90_01140, partial [Acidimicrobiales bacterium]|nr:hypothetical protein [Acidimicrobiales bacterium]